MDKPINAQGRHGRIKVRNREQMSKSVRRAVVGGYGGRVPLIKLNFNHRQRHTQIPDSQSANLRQMILLSFPATLGVGTAQILIKKKEPVNYFPPASKTWTTEKKKICVYMWCFSVVVLGLSVSAEWMGVQTISGIYNCLLTCNWLRHGTQKDVIFHSRG